MKYIIKCEGQKSSNALFFIQSSLKKELKCSVWEVEKVEYKSLNLDERRLIEKMNARGISAYEIADIIGRHQATIYRELKRGSGSGKPFRNGYSAEVANERAKLSYKRRGRRKKSKGG